jgi:hypothetical protein
MNKVAFCIGNGKSRENFNLETLRGKGTIIGCNGLAREFVADIMVAVDAKMIQEIKDSGYGLKSYFLIPGNRSRYKDMYKLDLKGFSTSGGFALKVAGFLEMTNVYLFGYDCFGGNIFEHTKNYSLVKKNKYIKFLDDFGKAIKVYPNTNYINIVVNKADGLSGKLKTIKNYSAISVEEFNERLKISPTQNACIPHELYDINTNGKVISDLK